LYFTTDNNECRLCLEGCRGGNYPNLFKIGPNDFYKFRLNILLKQTTYASPFRIGFAHLSEDYKPERLHMIEDKIEDLLKKKSVLWSEMITLN